MEEIKPQSRFSYHRKRFISLAPSAMGVAFGVGLLFDLRPALNTSFNDYSECVQKIELQLDQVREKNIVSNEDIAGLVRDVYRFTMTRGINPEKVPEIAETVQNLAYLSTQSAQGRVDKEKAKAYLSISKSQLLSLEDRLGENKRSAEALSVLLGVTLLFFGGKTWLKEIYADTKIFYKDVRDIIRLFKESKKQKK